MKFNPCVSGKCTYEGSHCENCGRSRQEIAETKEMVIKLVNFAQKQGYENIEDFSNFIGRTLLKKLQKAAS